MTSVDWSSICLTYLFLGGVLALRAHVNAGHGSVGYWLASIILWLPVLVGYGVYLLVRKSLSCQ